MTRHWLKSYDPGVPAEIDPNVFPSVVALFDEAFGRYAGKTALTCFGSAMSYAELDRQSRAVTAYLQHRLGVKRGDRIAVMVPNVFAFPIVMLGIIRAGAVQVNVNPLYTPPELAHQLNDSGTEVIFIFGGSTPTLVAAIGQTSVRTVITVDLADGTSLPVPSPPADPRLTAAVPLKAVLAEGAGLAVTPVPLTGDDTMFLQYTGGTTGLSKGAVLSHRNIIANTEQFRAFMPDANTPGAEVVIAALPLYHIFGLMLVVAYIGIGGEIVLVPNPRDMDGLIRTMKSSRFTIMGGVNTLFSGMMLHPEFKDIDFSACKIAVGGGAAVIPATSEKWKSITGRHIKEGYGLSETSPILTINSMSMTEFTGSCGLPVPSTDIKLIDEEGREVPLGEAGEICAKGPQVMSGYYNKPEANKAAFTEDGYFRTGDIGVFDEQGYLRIVDRKKDMILVSGFNVYPNEVEAVVTSCPGVAECACVGAPDEKTGETVCIFVVALPNASITEEQISEHCRARLAAYKIPRRIKFVGEVPKSNVGKILRRELRDRA